MGLSILRFLTVLIIILICLVLIMVIKPTKREIKCSFITALIVAIVDYIFEFIMGYFKVWVYSFPNFNLFGIPIDLFLCFFFLTFALCIGFTFFIRLKYRFWRLGYVIVISLLLSTHSYYKNIEVASKGLISFIVDIKSLWFILGNYISITLVIVFAIMVYNYILAFNIIK